MKIRTILASGAIFIGLSLVTAAAPAVVPPPAPQEVKPDQLHAFYGRITQVDHAGRTFSIAQPMRYTFKVPAETEIVKQHGGGSLSFAAVQPGGGATVVALRGLTGWTARKITLEKTPAELEDLKAITTGGRTITGPDVWNYVTVGPGMHLSQVMKVVGKPGLFLLSVRADGTVGNVDVMKSEGSEELDQLASRRLARMKFRPGAFKEVQIPDVTLGSVHR